MLPRRTDRSGSKECHFVPRNPICISARALIALCIYTYTHTSPHTCTSAYKGRLGCTIRESEHRVVVRMGRRTMRESWTKRVGRGGGEIGWSAGMMRGEVKRRRSRGGGGKGKREVGEQYLGDFALYLEMSFVGSISSTIRTLSLCPGVYRGVGSIRVYLCLQIDTRRTWVHPPLPHPSFVSLFSSLLSSVSRLPPLPSPPIYVPAAALLNYVRIG